ncbi:MAG: VOC family protein [Chloroflexia bacterium]|nr:VOC family protein [Chloroflexia bacterium]
MSDVQPALYIDDIEEAIAFYRDGLGLTVNVFGTDPETGRPNIFLATIEDAKFLVSRDSTFAKSDGSGSGGVTLYFHLDSPVDGYVERFRSAEGVEIVEDLTDQWWGDRTFAIRDPWGYVLLFSSVPGGFI